MGRDLHWYVLPKNIEHQPDKQLCFNYEFEKDEDEIEREVYEKVTGKSSEPDLEKKEGETLMEYTRRLNQHKKDVQCTAWRVINNDENQYDWCPKCHLFAQGIYNNPLIIAQEHIGHSYSSPYWTSKWNIKDMYIGSSEGEFLRLFGLDKYYRQIDTYDVERAMEHITDLGEPLRTSDKEACEETMRVLTFLDKWTERDDVIVIMEDEI